MSFIFCLLELSAALFHLWLDQYAHVNNYLPASVFIHAPPPYYDNIYIHVYIYIYIYILYIR